MSIRVTTILEAVVRNFSAEKFRLDAPRRYFRHTRKRSRKGWRGYSGYPLY